MEVDKVPEKDFEEPFVDPENGQAQVDYIQCVDVVPCSTGTEEVTVHEEKDGDWGGGVLPLDPGVPGPAKDKERSPDIPMTTF